MHSINLFQEHATKVAPAKSTKPSCEGWEVKEGLNLNIAQKITLAMLRVKATLENEKNV
jgi:hypothetical protein